MWDFGLRERKQKYSQRKTEKNRRKKTAVKKMMVGKKRGGNRIQYEARLRKETATPTSQKGFERKQAKEKNRLKARKRMRKDRKDEMPA